MVRAALVLPSRAESTSVECKERKILEAELGVQGMMRKEEGLIGEGVLCHWGCPAYHSFDTWCGGAFRARSEVILFIYLFI